MNDEFSRVILIDKPAGMSSFGVVARVRRKLTDEKLAILRAKNPATTRKSARLKVGHCGTLDPFATGLLIVLTGENTKRAPDFSGRDKVYFAKFRLGETSSTGDPEGEISAVNFARKIPTRDEIEHKICSEFTGGIMQIPPLFSAIKIDGKRAYQLARAHENSAKLREKSDEKNDEKFAKSDEKNRVENANFAQNSVTKNCENLENWRAKNDENSAKISRENCENSDEKFAEISAKFAREKAREVTIFSWDIVDFSWPILTSRIHVSSGTYVRSLAEDLGKSLGVGGFCEELRREKTADFDVKNAQTLAEFLGENDENFARENPQN